MGEKIQADSKKILIVLLILALLFVGSVVLRQWKKSQLQYKMEIDKRVGESVKVTSEPETIVGTYKLKLDKLQSRIGDVITADAAFSLLGKRVTGSDVILIFDPEFLQVEGLISPGDFFAYYPRNDIDNNAGVIRISAFQATSQEPVTGEISLFKVKFRTKKQGETMLDFQFEKGKTDLTTLVEYGTSRNILESAQGAQIKILE